ncbi:BglG family transcription antiterminator [Carnobacterium maltaromaticum]|uniref:BglG family transcription antiterminator n=1 Tax=Carnobacterium maltaromaticum TaxID=2751 RepID=UPI0039BE9616
MSKLSYQRLDDILEMLLKHSDSISMKELTSTFSVSDRTIRTDINNLNDTLKNVGATVSLLRGKGYSLDILNQKAFTTWRNDSLTSNDFNLTSLEERQSFLLFTLFKAAQPVSLDRFLEQLFVSKNTFYSYLKSIRDALIPYGIKIVNRPNIGFEIIGHEFSKRKAINELLIVKDLQEYLVGFTEMELSLFDTIDLELLQALELESLAALELLDSDYYHKTILSNFALALSRIVDNKTLTTFPVRIPVLKKNAQVIMNQFLTKIEHSFELKLTKEERNYFNYCLSINAPRLVETEKEVEQSSTIAHEIVAELLEIIQKTANYDWREDVTLIKDLTSHVEGFINMNLIETGRSNPLLDTIKNSFPLAFDLCLTHLETIGMHYGLYFSEDEIGYIALHIAGAIERSATINHRKHRVILICGTGRTMSRIIEAKINKRYQDKIDIVDRLSYIELQQYNLTEIDFVITTVPLEKMETPSVYIHMGQLDKEIEKVEPFMEKIKTQTSTIFDLFSKDFFLYNPSVQSKKELLQKMIEPLKLQGIVPDDFYESVWIREKISQTNINRVLAIPHPMSLTSIKSKVAVAIMPNGIDWGNGEKVHFIFLFAIKKEDYEDTGDIYDLLLEFIDREDSQKIILNTPTFDSFIEILKEI